MMILPRQAWDKHRENSKKDRFVADECGASLGGGAALFRSWRDWLCVFRGALNTLTLLSPRLNLPRQAQDRLK
jgi:hypothetical protein